MSERCFFSEIRVSRRLGLRGAITLSLGVMLTLTVFVLPGGVVAAARGAARLSAGCPVAAG